VDDPTKHEVVALAPWQVQLWLVDVDRTFYDSTSITTHVDPPSVHVQQDEPTPPIVTLRQLSPDASTVLTDLTKARPLIRTEMNVKSHDGGQLIFELADCTSTLDFVSKDFEIRFSLPTQKSKAKTSVILANGQRVTSSKVCEITFELARHEFKRTFTSFLIYALLT
jgi:hypothetical protein